MKVLMIGAHQDDNEFRGGGLAHKLVQNGHTVRFLSLTNGSGGHHLLSIEETVKRRAAESAAVAKLLGVEYEVWDHNDCILMADLPTRQRLIRAIRTFAPDLVITHRPNDYHADHRAAGQLVQDASYLLVVPHECPDVPAMRAMPTILYYEDRFHEPEFRADLVIDMDREIDIKLRIADCNVSQVYEWLPYVEEPDEVVPATPEARFEWLKGMNVTAATTDEEILAAPRGYAVRFAKTAARFRRELIAYYGQERGSVIRFAEAFQVCEYGNPLTEDMKTVLYN